MICHPPSCLGMIPKPEHQGFNSVGMMSQFALKVVGVWVLGPDALVEGGRPLAFVCKVIGKTTEAAVMVVMAGIMSFLGSVQTLQAGAVRWGRSTTQRILRWSPIRVLTLLDTA